MTAFLVDEPESAPADLQAAWSDRDRRHDETDEGTNDSLCTFAVSAALMIGGVAAGYAKGAKCACDSGSVTHLGSDGSECAATCNGKHAGSATSSAVGNGSDASAAATFRGKAKQGPRTVGARRV